MRSLVHDLFILTCIIILKTKCWMPMWTNLNKKNVLILLQTIKTVQQILEQYKFYGYSEAGCKKKTSIK